MAQPTASPAQLPVALPPSSPRVYEAPAAAESTGESIVVASTPMSASLDDGDESEESDRSSFAQAAAQVAAPPAVPLAAVPGAQVAPEQLVVQGTMALDVGDPAETVRALRGEVARLGGRIVSEQVDGAAESWGGVVRVRLLPARVQDLVNWLERHGDVTSKRMEATDVSRTLVDQEIALENLTVTLDRMRKLLDAGGLSMQDILTVEREMTRLRGEIERIKGEKRWLEDRVAQATLDIQVRRRTGELLSPRTKLYPGPRLAMLTLFDPDGRQRTRLGGGVAVHIVVPRITLELDVFDDVEASGDRPAEGHAVLATWGAAMYSDFLGRGLRRFLNPFIGFRAGYGYLDHHAFAVQAELGVELIKQSYILVDASVRATALLGDDETDGGLVSGASIVFAF